MLDIRDAASVVAYVTVYQPPKWERGKPLPAFVVEVPAVTRGQIEDLTKACNAVNSSASYLSDEERVERFNAEHRKRAPDLFIRGWQGCTVEALAHLGIPLGAPPELDADGCIPYDVETARQVWAKAYPERFAQKIAAHSRDILEGEALAERDRKNA